MKKKCLVIGFCHDEQLERPTAAGISSSILTDPEKEMIIMILKLHFFFKLSSAQSETSF